MRVQTVVGSLVAPFTGAWIETIIHLTSFAVAAVAPFTGAWIETLRSQL